MVAQSQIVFFFDYDDTLFPTTLSRTRTLSEEEKKNLEYTIIKTISEARKLGSVFIITNAESGWVELCLNRHIPGVLPHLKKVRKIVSARSRYEQKYPNEPEEWKYRAMDDCLQNTLRSPESKTADQLLFHAISFGDSEYERKAVHRVSKNHKQLLTKSVKFIENPTVPQLIKQLDTISSYLQEISKVENNLDLMTTITYEK